MEVDKRSLGLKPGAVGVVGGVGSLERAGSECDIVVKALIDWKGGSSDICRRFEVWIYGMTIEFLCQVGFLTGLSNIRNDNQVVEFSRLSQAE